MDKQFDVIVVGAGNGGLAAAANTAKAGLNTLLLEKHNIPGGCATSFRRGRFEFEPSLHELCSVGTAEKPDKVYTIFDELGAKPEWRYETGHLFRAIVKGEDGYDVRLSAGIDGFCESVESVVPGSKQGVRAFVDLKKKSYSFTTASFKTYGEDGVLRAKATMKYGTKSVTVEIAVGSEEKPGEAGATTLVGIAEVGSTAAPFSGQSAILAK